MSLFESLPSTRLIISPGFRNADVFRDLNPLAIQKVRISRLTSTSRTPADANAELPPTLRRVGLFLLSQLRIHYQSKQSPIANLTASQACDRLKEQLLQYQKASYPFDRPLLSDDTAQRWWARLDEDKGNESQPMAVSTFPLKYAILVFHVRGRN